MRILSSDSHFFTTAKMLLTPNDHQTYRSQARILHRAPRIHALVVINSAKKRTASTPQLISQKRLAKTATASMQPIFSTTRLSDVVKNPNPRKLRDSLVRLSPRSCPFRIPSRLQ